VIKNQKNQRGNTQFKGIAVFNRIELDKFCEKTIEKYQTKGEVCLSYDRSPDINNLHHGNLLLKNVDKDAIRDQIISTLIQLCFIGYHENDI